MLNASKVQLKVQPVVFKVGRRHNREISIDGIIDPLFEMKMECRI